MIRLIIIYIFCIVTIAGGCFSKNRYVTYDDKENVRKYCFQCHAPSDSLLGGPLNEMYNIQDERQFKLFLSREFANNNTPKIIEHSKIKLTKKEVESVMMYLKSLD